MEDEKQFRKPHGNSSIHFRRNPKCNRLLIRGRARLSRKNPRRHRNLSSVENSGELVRAHSCRADHEDARRTSTQTNECAMETSRRFVTLFRPRRIAPGYSRSSDSSYSLKLSGRAVHRLNERTQVQMSTGVDEMQAGSVEQRECDLRSGVGRCEKTGEQDR